MAIVSPKKPDLSVSFAGISFKNPVIAASGTFGYGVEFEDIVSLEKLGGFVTKGLSLEPLAGNPPPRLFETAAGMLNSIGLQNIGARAFIEEKLPKLQRKKSLVVIANVFGYTREEYVGVIRLLNEAEGIAAYELNVSCPNTKGGGITFGSDRLLLEELVSSCKSAARRPLMVKLSPNVTSIPALTPSHWSTPSWQWPSMPRSENRAFRTSLPDSADRRSSRSRCAWSTKQPTQ